jgi:hypothetical protein
VYMVVVGVSVPLVKRATAVETTSRVYGGGRIALIPISDIYIALD